MTDCLFIGSFLSGSKGSLSVSEFVAAQLKERGMRSRLASYQKNKFLRIADIIGNILFARAQFIHIEVYSGQAFRIAEIAALCAQLVRTPVILTLHGGRLPEFASANKERIAKLFAKAHTIATPSLYLKNYFEGNGYTLTYLPNSVDLSRFPYERTQVKPFSLLWVRGFNPIYNPELAVKTLHEVRKTFPQTTLTMVGPDGGSLAQTRELVDSLGLHDAVTFTGPVPNTELKNYYQSHSIYLNTPSYESFGVAVIEAASCGIPIVSTHVGEIPYLWEHEKNMLLVNTFDEKDFAREVVRLFNNTSLAASLSDAARQQAATFNWKNIAPQWLNLLQHESIFRETIL